MTKAELIDKMAKDAEISKAAAGKALSSFLSGIEKSVKKGVKVTLVGFGSFKLAKRKARIGRNPKTGDAIKIKATKSMSFSAGKAIKDALNK
jgi:DNA-binding protein HU-beta